jgi:acyl carrier protein
MNSESCLPAGRFQIPNSALNKEVVELVAKILKKPIEKVRPEANLFDELGVDSLLGVEIFAALDKKYGVDIPDVRLKEIATLNDLVNLVEELKK